MSKQSNINLICNFAGENNEVVPRICRLYCPNNTLAEVAAAGFLDLYLKTSTQQLLETDFIATVASDGHQWYKPVFTNRSCQLKVLP